MLVLLSIGLILASVIIHEAGHALAAIVLKLRVKEIALGLPFPPKFEFKFKEVGFKITPCLISI